MKTVPCTLCKIPTPMLGTKLCNRCWELNSRIRLDPELTLRIQYEMSPVRKQFESRNGITATNYNSPETNFQIVQIVTNAFALQMPVEILRFDHWHQLLTTPISFNEYTYRKG